MSEVKVEKVKVLDTRREGVHWGWYLFWLIVFLPVIMILVLVHCTSKQEYYVAVKYSNKEVEKGWVSKAELAELEMEAGGW